MVSYYEQASWYDETMPVGGWRRSGFGHGHVGALGLFVPETIVVGSFTKTGNSYLSLGLGLSQSRS